MEQRVEGNDQEDCGKDESKRAIGRALNLQAMARGVFVHGGVSGELGCLFNRLAHNDISSPRRHAVKVGMRGKGEPVGTPLLACRAVGEHGREARIERGLGKGQGDHAAGTGLLDVVGVAAGGGGQ